MEIEDDRDETVGGIAGRIFKLPVEVLEDGELA